MSSGQRSFKTGDILGRVDPDTGIIGEGDMNTVAVFKSAELLEFLGCFIQPGLERGEFAQEIGAVGVKPEVPVACMRLQGYGIRLPAAFTVIGDRCAGEIKCEACLIANDFDLIGVVEVGRVDERRRKGGHRRFAIFETCGQCSNLCSGYKGFIALHIDNRLRSNGGIGLREAIGPRRMGGICQDCLEARVHQALRQFRGIDGKKEWEFGCFGTNALGGPKDDGLAPHLVKDLAGKTLRGHASWANYGR